ncbi:MAG: GNAT family N-acetyltransferase [Epsilonproteobacteria bacterium]|nr:GNAT family N-acetyltransferase [Campylobacterota bacterium]
MTRKAKKRDIALLDSLLLLLYKNDEDYNPKSHAKALRKLIKYKELGRLFFYELDESIVALGTLVYQFSVRKNRTIGVIDEIIVHPDYQNSGIATDLIREIMNYAKGKKIKELRISYEHDEPKMARVLQKLEFKESSALTMRKKLKND